MSSQRYYRLKAEAEARAAADALDLAMAEALVEIWKCSPLDSLSRRATEHPEESLTMALALVHTAKPAPEMT